MKKILSVLLCLLLFALAACSANKPDDPSLSESDPDIKGPDITQPDPGEKDDGTVKFSEYVFNGAYTDEALSHDPLVNLTVSLPQVNNNEYISMYYDNILSRLKESAQTYYLDTARGNYQLAADGIGVFSPITVEVDFNVMRNDGLLFSVARGVYENTGAPHPFYTLISEVFRISDGARLIFDDIFTVDREQAIARLTPQILEQMDAIEVKYGPESVYYNNARAELWELWSYDDFYLTDDSLVMIWQTYAIAPYASGLQVFEIPLASIADIVDTQWLSK